ncbi:MAG TPA: DUF1080 domain-containing protein [Mucilaginibacter sp.]
MKKYLIYYILLIVLTLLFLIPKVQAQPAKAWKSIFNGKDMQGWTVVEKIANVHVADSSFIIHMTANTHRHAYIRTDEKFGDFILELDVKKDTIYDSGIMLRCVDTPDSLVSLQGYQVKLDPHPERMWNGSVFDDFGDDKNFRYHWFYTIEHDDRARAAFKNMQWNHFRIEAIGNNIKVWINGVPITNMLNNKYTKGYIALKLHYLQNKPENEKYSAQFKNIRVVDKGAAKYARAMDIPTTQVN